MLFQYDPLCFSPHHKYGDDSLDPEKMEHNERPVAFDRLTLHLSQILPCADEPSLLKDKLMEKVQRSLEEDRFQILLPKGRAFLNEIENYFKAVVEKQIETIESCTDGALINQRTWNSCRFTETQVNEFLKIAFTKYTKGENIGYAPSETAHTCRVKNRFESLFARVNGLNDRFSSPTEVFFFKSYLSENQESRVLGCKQGPPPKLSTRFP